MNLRTLDNPYPTKPIHMAAKIRDDGAVSPLCSSSPRAINLKQTTWTLRPIAVTCPRCRAIQDGASNA